MSMQGSFNANQFEPNQGFSIHPPAQKVPFTITKTEIKENSAKNGGYFSVEFTSPMGSLINIYNIWSNTPKAVEIAHGQLSALCRATGRYQINWQDEGKALLGATGLMDVAYQKGEEPSPDNPNAKGYTELKRVYDVAGNDPSKPNAAPAQQHPQGQQAAPLTQQNGGGWGQGGGQPNPNQQPANQGWQGGNQQPQEGNPNQNAASQQQGGAWQPGNAAPSTSPPWGSR